MPALPGFRLRRLISNGLSLQGELIEPHQELLISMEQLFASQMRLAEIKFINFFFVGFLALIRPLNSVCELDGLLLISFVPVIFANAFLVISRQFLPALLRQGDPAQANRVE